MEGPGPSRNEEMIVAEVIEASRRHPLGRKSAGSRCACASLGGFWLALSCVGLGPAPAPGVCRQSEAVERGQDAGKHRGLEKINPKLEGVSLLEVRITRWLDD